MRPLYAMATQNSNTLPSNSHFYFQHHFCWFYSSAVNRLLHWLNRTAEVSYFKNANVNSRAFCVRANWTLWPRALCTFPDPVWKYFPFGLSDNATVLLLEREHLIPTSNCVNKNKNVHSILYFPCVALTVLSVHTIFVANKAKLSHSTQTLFFAFSIPFSVYTYTATHRHCWLSRKPGRQANRIEFHNVIRANHYNGINANIRNCNNNIEKIRRNNK